MSAPLLVLGPRAQADAVAHAVRDGGAPAVVVVVGDRPLATPSAVVRTRRAIATHRPEACVSLSPRAHRVARLAASKLQWTAHVEEPPTWFRDDRWGRVLDPRARVLRRADAVTAPPAVAEALHQGSGVAVSSVANEPALAARARRPWAAAQPGGLTLLMLGTVNTPHVEHLALAMRDRGHRVVVAGDVVPGYPPSVLPAEGVEVRPLELPAIPWVRRLAREIKPDVVHAHWLTAYGFLAALNRLHPLIAMAWGSDVYHATPLQLRQIRYVLKRADVAMTDSTHLLDRLIELGADREHSHVLNWGVDLGAFAPAPDREAVRRELGLDPGPLVLSPRALTPLYNPRVIVDAFEQAATPGAQLALKHIGTTEPDLGRPLPPAARIVGHVPYEQLAEWYRAADICVSIPDSDSSPRSVWEAMACGCACILSDLPWVSELIERERHALVVAPEVPAVAEAMARLLADPALAARMGAEARALVERHRDQATEMDRLSALYETVARGAG
jgi:glycosyltransferase involved in cell wall biosynthesis